MSAILPRPGLSLLLLCIWLLLNQTLAPAHFLLGGIISIAVPLLTQSLMPHKLRLRNPVALMRLLTWALVEISRSCFNVSMIILFRQREKVNSQFIYIPLDMHDPYGLAMLSCLINCTPGTVWVEVTPEKHELYLHVFDLHDEAWWINTIKTRYEKPLMDVFEGAADAGRT